MTNQVKEYIKQILPLEGDNLDIFLSKFKPLHLEKGDFFIKEGQVSNSVGFILKGSLLCSYNKNGKEIIDDFSLENEFITDYFSFLTRAPSDKDVKCLEDSELLIINYDDMQDLYAQKKVFEKVGRLIAESLFINWQLKSKSLMLDNSEERYLSMLQKRPNLSQRVPQYLIASYLNIEPETLSRIRKNISKRTPKLLS